MTDPRRPLRVAEAPTLPRRCSARPARHGAVFAILPLLAACHAATQVPARVPGPAAPPRVEAAAPASLPDAVHWVRNSAEYRASALQAYRLAGSRIEQLAAGRTSGTWAVILDADETLLDNSAYQKERAAQGLGFTPETWRMWVARREARAIPGAADFLRGVQALGGRIAVVTNRTESECPDTEANLAAEGLVADAVLCRPDSGPSDKQPRFDRVAQGQSAPGLPALEVLMWVGDNILDFPGLGQSARATPDTLADFGRRFILLPNPMYGSWERNPRE